MRRPNKISKIICVVAGGSGGHITPALCLGKKWLEQNPSGMIPPADSSILFFSSCGKIDKIVRGDMHATLLKLMRIPGKKFFRYPRFFFQLIVAFFKSFFALKKYRPEKIISTGGLVSIPVCLAGRLLRIPIELYELNVIPGKAISFLSRFASDVFVTFERSKTFFTQNATLVPYPLRFTESDVRLPRTQAKTIFFLGGSQGSLFLNNLVKTWIDDHIDFIRNQNIQIIHQVGLDHTTGWNDSTYGWKNFYEAKGITAQYFSYDKNIERFYSQSDVVVCRGGAGTLFELEFFRKKCVIIPLKIHALGHQVENAKEMIKRNPGTFCMLDQDEIKKDSLLFAKTMERFF